MKRFCLIQDDSCHWYICPADRRDEAERMIEAVESYWAGDQDGEPPSEPDFIERIDGPRKLTFTDWRV